MESNLIRYWCVSMLLFSALTRGQEPKTVAQTKDQDVQIIRLTAKKYEFSPSTVHVKAGSKVQLKITAIDRDHGFTTAVVPGGTDSSARPGIEFTFTSPQGSAGWKLKKSRETTIEFVAKTPGTYEFRCSVACGIHHGRMKGQLIVDP
jgi:cytochrome c oxidase subunit 2